MATPINKKATGPARKRASVRHQREYIPPATITLPPLLVPGGDVAFREALYLMTLTFGRLQSFRQAFGRELSLTASQFIVLIGTAYRQGRHGVTIRGLADHTQLAATHVTTEVGRLIDKKLLTKSANARDGRSVLVRLSQRGEAAVGAINPLLRRVNDRLFQNVSREEFAAVSRFLSKFALNSEQALADIKSMERKRSMQKQRSPGRG